MEGIGGIFLLLVVVVVVVVAVLAMTGNIGFLTRGGTRDPVRDLKTDDAVPAPGEQPRHTRVTIEQNEQDVKTGEPIDRP